MTTKIHETVLRRARTIHALRAVTGSASLAVLALIASLYVIGREVWVARVFQNMPDLFDIQALARFFEYAFAGTQPLVQAASVLSALAGTWLIIQLSRVANDAFATALPYSRIHTT